LLAYFDHLTRNKDAYFGNARTVRNIVEKVVKNQHLRLALMNSAQRSEHSIRLLCIDDVSEFDPHTSPVSQNRIGFRH